MSFTEVILKNNTTTTAKVKVNGELVPITVYTSEEVDIDTSITEMQAIDNTNKGWILDDGAVENSVEFLSSAVNETTTAHDKAGIISSTDPGPAYIAANAATTSILDRMETANGGNISFWFVIRKLDATNFKIEVSMYDAVGDVEDINVMFTEWEITEPIPEEIALTTTAGIGSKIAVDNTLTFGDPASAVGQTNAVVIDFLNGVGGSIDSIELTDVIVQDI